MYFDRRAAIEPLEDRRLLAGEPWGDAPKLIGQDLLASNFPSITGAGQSVAIIDTGVDYMHPALGGGFGPGHKVVAGWDFVDNDGDPMDTDGHGTGLAGVVAANEYVWGGKKYRGLAPGANIVALRTDGGSGGGGFNTRVEQALQWVINNRSTYNIAAINLSFGSGRYTVDHTMEPFGDELSTLSNLGVFISASSGNSGVQSPPSIEYPAAHPAVYAVGAVTPTDVIAQFSERSSLLDLLAPGQNLVIPYYNPGTGQHTIVSGAQGTSFAAPYAAAAAALLKQVDPSLSPGQIIQVLKDTGASNFDGDSEGGTTTGLTFKRLDIHAAVDAVMPEPDPDDAREDNDGRGSATQLSPGNTISDLRLVANDADFFSFTIGARSDVSIVYGGGFPAGQLQESNGSVLNTVNAGTTNVELAAGTYYLRFASGSTVSGTYSVRVNATPVVVEPPPPPPPEESPIAGTVNDVAYDSTGTLHVAFYDPSTKQLKYASRSAGGDWSGVITVDPTSGVGSHLSLALDSKGNPSVAYLDAVNKDLKYARKSGSSFVVTKVDASGATGYHPSLAFNAANKPLISYYDASRMDLRLATLSTKWTLKSLDSAGKTGLFTSLARNPVTRRFAVSYFSATARSYRVAEQTAKGTWSVKDIARSTSGAGGQTSLAYLPNGRPAFSFYDAASADLRYARYDGTKWSTQTITAAGSVGRYNALVFDAKDLPTVYYYDASSDDLYLARGTTPTKWTRVRLADGGTFVSAAVSPDNVKTPLFRAPDGSLETL